MKIESSVGDIDSVLYEYSDILGWDDGIRIPNGKDEMFEITGYGIKVPDVGFSVHPGSIMSLIEDEEWEVDSDAVFIYLIDQTDLSKFLGWSTGSIADILFDFSKTKSFSTLCKASCFFDTDDCIVREEWKENFLSDCERFIPNKNDE